MTFSIFNPRFGSFGDACTACEDKAAAEMATVNAAHLASDYNDLARDKTLARRLSERATDIIKAGQAAGLIGMDSHGAMESYRFIAVKGAAK